MLQSASRMDRRLEISRLRAGKGGISYTVDSVRHFRTQFPGDELAGSSAATSCRCVHKWKEIGALVS